MPQRFLNSLVLALCAALPAGAFAQQAVSYANASDEELTALGAHWNDLSADERRALLSEVKMRMARARSQGSAAGVLRIKLRRRYGTVPSGAAKGDLHIQVTTKKQVSKPFGVGFERRTGQQSDPAAAKHGVQDASAEAPDPG